MQKRRIFNRAFFSLFLLISIESYAADITLAGDFVNKIDSCTADSYFNGEIVEGDILVFERGISFIKKKFAERRCGPGKINLYLNSPGGSVDAAMKIGRIARKEEIQTLVIKECFSSCVFIMAGSVNRIVFQGKIGVHRPYLVDGRPLDTPEKMNERIKSINEKIKSYLNEMNIPISLYDLMNSIPPEEMKILTESERKLYLLEGEDPIYNEKMVAMLAKLYGLTSSEYRRRDTESNVSCSRHSNLTKRIICRSAILYGVSMQKYSKYEASARLFCNANLDPKKNIDRQAEEYFSCHTRFIREKP